MPQLTTRGPAPRGRQKVKAAHAAAPPTSTEPALHAARSNARRHARDIARDDALDDRRRNQRASYDAKVTSTTNSPETLMALASVTVRNIFPACANFPNPRSQLTLCAFRLALYLISLHNFALKRLLDRPTTRYSKIRLVAATTESRLNAHHAALVGSI